MDCFNDTVDLLATCEERTNCISSPAIEEIMYRLETAVHFVQQTLSFINNQDAKENFEQVSRNLQVLHQKWHRKLQEIELRSAPNCTHLAVYSTKSPATSERMGPGRPKFIIEEEALLQFRSLGFNWKDIASLLLVSRWTVWRRVRELEISEETGFSEIGNDELDHIVRSFMTSQGCMVGYSMVRGHLRGIGIKLQRSRIRASIARVDPINSCLRWATVVSRRSYSVAGPNSLWHLDGHHSLITWGFVIHGCIDGFSRLICFLECSTNNRKETVEALFLASVQKYSWPSRVRTDHGGENFLVWEHMNAIRGEGRGSALVGSSTHNQRIERLWRDVFRCFGHVFYYTFKAMQECGLLDIENPIHKFMLHYVYLPRINHAIASFAAAWNKHPIRTERSWSPEQMWSNGMIDLANGQLRAVADVAESVNSSDLEWYGFDPGAPLPSDDGLSIVEVDDVNLDLPDNVLTQVANTIDPLAHSTSFGIDIFERGLLLLQDLLSDIQE